MTDVRAAATTTTGAGRFMRALVVQKRVIKALLLRELHTRYGRDNIGYLWVFGEPMFLATAIGILHAAAHANFGQTINPVALAVLGYCTFIIFRAVVGRSEGMLESNMPLLYHRVVTMFDMLIARIFLEFCAGVTVTLVLMFACIELGYTTLPERPLDFMIGVVLLCWFAFGVSMVISAGTYERHTLGRFVHPVMYICMPISGAFFTMSSLTAGIRNSLLWFPLAPIFEQIRYGWFETASDKYLCTGYVVSVDAVLTYIGLIMVRRVRRRVHLR